MWTIIAFFTVTSFPNIVTPGVTIWPGAINACTYANAQKSTVVALVSDGKGLKLSPVNCKAVFNNWLDERAKKK